MHCARLTDQHDWCKYSSAVTYTAWHTYGLPRLTMIQQLPTIKQLCISHCCAVGTYIEHAAPMNCSIFLCMSETQMLVSGQPHLSKGVTTAIILYIYPHTPYTIATLNHKYCVSIEVIVPRFHTHLISAPSHHSPQQ